MKVPNKMFIRSKAMGRLPSTCVFRHPSCVTILPRGVTKTRNGKRNGMENGMKRKTKTEYMNFVDTTAYKGKRFEI